MSDDPVNHPQHYGGDTPHETIRVLSSWLTPEQFMFDKKMKEKTP